MLTCTPVSRRNYAAICGSERQFMHENGSSGHETAKLGRSKGVREFVTKRPRGNPPTTSSGGNLVGGFLNRNKRSALWAVAPIEVAARRGIPPANFIVATLHRRDCSLKFDLRTDEIPATGGHRFFAHFDSPGHCKSMLPGFCFSAELLCTCPLATERVATLP